MTKYRLMMQLILALTVTCSLQAHARGGGMSGGTGGGMGSGAGSGFGGGFGSDVDRDDQGRIRYGFNRNNVFGWELMSEEERTAHSEKMFGITTLDECNTYQEQHQKQMEARAREKGSTLSEPGNNACGRMKAKGYFK